MRNLTTQEVANLAGIHKDTLLRWLRKGWVSEPGRDLRNWRVFTYEQAIAVQNFARRVSEPQPEYETSDDQLSLLNESVSGTPHTSIADAGSRTASGNSNSRFHKPEGPE